MLNPEHLERIIETDVLNIDFTQTVCCCRYCEFLLNKSLSFLDTVINILSSIKYCNSLISNVMDDRYSNSSHGVMFPFIHSRFASRPTDKLLEHVAGPRTSD